MNGETPRRVWIRPPITAMPSALFAMLHGVRSAFFRLASLFDAVIRRAWERDPRPPLWLQRHVGCVRNLESAAREMSDFIRRLELVRPDDHVLDVGSGTGVMAFAFGEMLGGAATYIGFDVDPAAIKWCQAAFSADPRFSFRLAKVTSPFGGRSSWSTPIGSFRFPMADQEAGFILAKSVFTHLLEDDARHYLSEIERTLRPGRAALITAFLFSRGSLTDRGHSPIFAFADQRGVIRWRWKARPASAVAYEREHFTRMIEDAGLRLQWFCQGFWPGDTTSFTGQDILVLGH